MDNASVARAGAGHPRRPGVCKGGPHPTPPVLRKIFAYFWGILGILKKKFGLGGLKSPPFQALFFYRDEKNVEALRAETFVFFWISG